MSERSIFLAAAHAELSNFPEAISFAEKALPLAPTHEKPIIQSRLALYREGKPYRDTPSTKPAESTERK